MASTLKLWQRRQWRIWFGEGLVIFALLWFAGFIFSNTTADLGRQGIATGFGFWDKTAGFSVIQSLLPFQETSTYGMAFWVGLCNTFLVAGIGIIGATLIGFIGGIARLSPNWLVAKLAALYVEALRNVPLLLQIFFWYFVVLRALPAPRQAINLGDMIFLTNRGLYLPSFQFSASPHWQIPVLQGLNFHGGTVMIPEFAALAAGLILYTGTFIAEIVRAGIQGVAKGQTEAAVSLGFTRWQTLRLIILPQALRLIVPPLTSQYLNLVKNSSLGAAIGYPELVSVFAGTVLNQTGQAVETIALTMMVYLTLSLIISFGMNLYNRRVAVKER